MLPNHAPLLIAEQFGTLAALHPGRVDLGLGRAPGSDQIDRARDAADSAGDVDDFPQDVVELMGYFRPAAAGPARAGGARRGARRAGLDPRLQHLRRAAGGDARAALRVRLAFRAGG